MASFFEDALTAEKSPFCQRQMNSGMCHAPIGIIGTAEGRGFLMLEESRVHANCVPCYIFAIMLKRLTVFAVFGTFLLGWPCLAKINEGNANAEHNQAAQSQQPVPATHVIIDSSPATEQHNADSKVGKMASEDKTLLRFLNPEWIIVYITAIYVFISAGTLIAIKKQAALMARQSDIQKANMRQWVVPEFVGTEQDGEIFEQSGEFKQHLPINIKFQVANRTPLPLTITRIATSISRPVEGREPEWETFEVNEREILPPMMDGRSGTYPYFVPLRLEGEAVKTYQRNQYIVSISGRIFFEPAVGGIEEHSFGSLVKCSPFKDEILPYAGKTPTQIKFSSPVAGGSGERGREGKCVEQPSHR